MAIRDCLMIGQMVKDELLDLQHASHDTVRFTDAERVQIKSVLKFLAELADPDQENPSDAKQAAAFAQIIAPK